MPEVRHNLLKFQRNFANNPPHGHGAVLDGRDIGSVVVPETPLKLFIDAKLEVRAERRFKELIHAGQSVMYCDVLDDMRERDHRDRKPIYCTAKGADGAKTIDTSRYGRRSRFLLLLWPMLNMPPAHKTRSGRPEQPRSDFSNKLNAGKKPTDRQKIPFLIHRFSVDDVQLKRPLGQLRQKRVIKAAGL